MSSKPPNDSDERCGVDRLIDLLETDIDLELLERARRKTPTQRIAWLMEMQEFAEAAKRAAAARKPK